MSEVPLYDTRGWERIAVHKIFLFLLQGYLAHDDPPPLGPYSRTIPRDLWCFYEEWLSLMSEVPL